MIVSACSSQILIKKTCNEYLYKETGLLIPCFADTIGQVRLLNIINLYERNMEKVPEYLMIGYL